MTRSRAGKERIANLQMAEYYAQRSAAGLLITEATNISEEANGWNVSPGIYTDEMVEGWKHVVSAVHDKGGVIFLQLWYMGRASHSSFHNGKPAVAPSPIKRNEDSIHTPTLRVMDGLAFGFHELGEPMRLAAFRKVFPGPLMGNSRDCITWQARVFGRDGCQPSTAMVKNHIKSMEGCSNPQPIVGHRCCD